MRLAPGVGDDEAAGRAFLKAFLEAVSVIGWNDQCTAFLRSGQKWEGKGRQEHTRSQKQKLEELAVAAGGRWPYRWLQGGCRHENLNSDAKPAAIFYPPGLKNGLTREMERRLAVPRSSLTSSAFRAHSHPSTRWSGSCFPII
jgi:hypothetical protein